MSKRLTRNSITDQEIETFVLKNCTKPDRDVPRLLCGYPLPCPWHTATIELADNKVTVPILVAAPNVIDNLSNITTALRPTNGTYVVKWRDRYRTPFLEIEARWSYRQSHARRYTKTSAQIAVALFVQFYPNIQILPRIVRLVPKGSK